jgi:hypothetical protein
VTANEHLLDVVIQTRDAVGEVKAEVIRWAGETEQIKNQLTRLNGTVAEHAAWKNSHDARIHEASVAEAAVAQQRALIVGRVQRVKKEIENWSPALVFGGGLLLALTGAAQWIYWWLQ